MFAAGWLCARYRATLVAISIDLRPISMVASKPPEGAGRAPMVLLDGAGRSDAARSGKGIVGCSGNDGEMWPMLTVGQ